MHPSWRPLPRKPWRYSTAPGPSSSPPNPGLEPQLSLALGRTSASLARRSALERSSMPAPWSPTSATRHGGPPS
eukprot:1156538-Heterocapsa_arctica.AAC.1